MEKTPTVTPTTAITDDDRAAADRTLAVLDRKLGPVALSERIAWAIAEARTAGYVAGLAENHDDAHESGYREGYDAGWHEAIVQ